MAKKEEKQKKQKKERSTTHTTNVVNILAFLALAAAAILLTVGPILRKVLSEADGGLSLQILNIVAMYCLLGAIAIPAWHFVRGKKKGWKIFYFIALAIYVLGTVFGVTFGIGL